MTVHVGKRLATGASLAGKPIMESLIKVRRKSFPFEHFGKAAGVTNICAGCLSFRYDLFNILEEVQSLYFYPGLRYHISSIWELEEGTRSGCPCCDVILKGISLFWDVNLSALSEQALQERHRYYNERKSEGLSSSEEEAENQEKMPPLRTKKCQFYRPCIEIRPGGSLLISHVIHDNVEQFGDSGKGKRLKGGAHMFKHFLMRAPLELYDSE